ncbi:MAG: hypothetical protein HY321_05140 [Armatimonadetes bacterium]|nr:hypothetical protein [Armatimonadota bacterium]
MQNVLPVVLAPALVFGLSLSAIAAPADQPGPLRVGTATADITPEAPAWLYGFGGRDGVKASEGVARKLLAQCAVFDNGQTRVALVSLDLGRIGYAQLRRLRAAAEAASIPQQHLMVNVSHTHFAPYDEDRVPGVRNGEYGALLAERTRGLFAAAVADLQPALLDFAVGSCVMGMNRRYLKPDGTYRGGPEPRKPIDPDVPVLRVLDAQGQVRAVLFGYACHPTTAGGRAMFLLGTDYPGYARDWVAAAYPGAVPIFFQGCGGDIKPRSIRPSNGGSPGQFHCVLLNEEEMKKAVGYELGRAVVAATAVLPPPVPANRPQELEAALAVPVPLGGIVEAVPLPSKEHPGQMHTYPWHIGVWRIGDLYLFGSQGELLNAIGRRIKREMPGVRAWTCGYTHWGSGYFADAASRPEGGYEVDNTAFAVEAEEILVGNARRYVKELQRDPVHAAPVPRLHP